MNVSPTVGAQIAGALLSTIVIALENGAPMATNIIAVPRAPVSLTACKLNKAGAYWEGNAVVANRTKHLLSEARIMLTAYDGEHTKMDQEAIEVRFDDPVASGETAPAPIRVGFNLRGPEALLANVGCRMQSATFSANKRWTYGEKWPENLVPLKSDVTSDAGSAHGSLTRASAPALPASIAVTNAWNDMLQGALLVHTALNIQGGDADATLTPDMLVLTMQLANGAQKQYSALIKPAPTYQKINPLGSTTTTAYEVDPKDDLGSLGSVIVPAHATVHIVATFFIGSDVVADKNANRRVALR